MSAGKNYENQQKLIQSLTRKNLELEKIVGQYHRVCRSEKERVKELNCLYQAAQCVVVETDQDTALEKMVRIIPGGWQHPDQACACIRVRDKKYLSLNFRDSPVCQEEIIFLDRQPVGRISVYYTDAVDPESPDPFLVEERNLIRGIANIISFFLQKLRDAEKARLVQQQFLHVDRLATIGRLAAGVAHELNEPLSHILGLAQLALKNRDLPDQTAEDLEKIESRVLYAREIIKSLMDFSRQSAMEKRCVDLNRLVDDSVSFLEPQCRKQRIVIARDYGLSPMKIRVDPVQIKQVITNLALNGIQAMTGGGKLTLTTRRTDSSVVFSVRDTGAGIAEEHMGKAFVPFFTTKDVGDGTGLGLSVVYGIVQNHEGDIKVSSSPGQGAVFHVTLPAGQDR